MTLSSPPNADQADAAVPGVRASASGASRSQLATKAAVTVKRRREERRVDKLAEIRAQIADGTLVVRQMTVAQHKAATQAARRSRMHSEARRKLNRQLRAS